MKRQTLFDKIPILDFGSQYTQLIARRVRDARFIANPDAPEGHLIYLKPRLTGGEPADLLNYQCTHPGFPHESTADQWFDESQFESYRKLGHHIGKEVFDAVLIEATQRQEMAGDSGPILPWLCEILRERRDEAV